jgi:acyl transferase domain-containing protein
MSPHDDVRTERNLEDDPANLAAQSCTPIAIVGIGFRGPGDAKNVAKLWEMILAGREAWSPIPAKRWNNVAFYHPDNARHGTVSWSSFV